MAARYSHLIAMRPGSKGKIVKIGGACAFYGDTSVAPTQLLSSGVDYLALDYLAEATMSTLARVRSRSEHLQYARDFTEWVWRDNLRKLKETGTRIVTNAGGLNPPACVRRMKAIAAEMGLSFKIACIEGDDVIGRIGEFAAEAPREMFSHAPFPEVEAVKSANAYLGAAPIVQALHMGAEVVVTGRVVDSALALGPLLHEFGWRSDDYDRLSAGSLAGHIIECGAQATGGLFTDWQDVPDWAHIGYPIVECEADGCFTIAKPQGTGGLINPAVVTEQILYEIGDPQAYILPDVVCDLSNVRLEQTGENRVRVSGAVGRPPTGKYKVSLIYQDGYRAIGFMPVVGHDAVLKAERQADALLTRVGEMLREKNLAQIRAQRVEMLGAEASYGGHARRRDTREVICKIGVEHDDRNGIGVFLREFDAPTTSMAVGTTGWFGSRAKIEEVMRVYSFEIPRDNITVSVQVDDTYELISESSAPNGDSRPKVAELAFPVNVRLEAGTKLVRLIDLAWARSGDKGNAFNIGVIARKPEYIPYIAAALTEEALFEWFAHDFDGAQHPRVVRYPIPGLNALNLHFIDALGGGQFSSLRLDPLAKGKAQQLLEIPIAVPANFEIQPG